MKLVSFEGARGVSFGWAGTEGIVDLGDRFPGRWKGAKGSLADRPTALDVVGGSEADCAREDVTLLPPIPDPEKIVCVAINYFDDKPSTAVPDYPLLFLRLPASQTGHRAPPLKPSVSDKLDFEGQLAVVIGQPGRKISEARALDHVAGYACYNDCSVRDWQKHSSQFTAGKNLYRTGGFGPWIVTSDELSDPADLNLETRVNGVTKQKTNTSRMIFSIPRLIAHVSIFAPLEPGDVVVSGTPRGFGSTRSPPEYLCSGNVAEVEIEDVGTLMNPVFDEQDFEVGR